MKCKEKLQSKNEGFKIVNAWFFKLYACKVFVNQQFDSIKHIKLCILKCYHDAEIRIDIIFKSWCLDWF